METQNNINNGVNPNQQPQPQKEEEKKKKNKFVAWWLGLNKWAKVGICAGTAAVLATAITLPLVLKPNKSSEIEMAEVNEGYRSEIVSLKKGVEYTFKCTMNDEERTATLFYLEDATGEVMALSILESAEVYVNNAKSDWKIDESTDIKGTDIKGTDKPNIVVKIKVNTDNSQVRGFLQAGK